jgi:hypothetical protein
MVGKECFNMRYLIPLLFLFSCTQEVIDELPTTCNGNGYLSIENSGTIDIVAQQSCSGSPCGNLLKARAKTTTVFEVKPEPNFYYFTRYGITEERFIAIVAECDTAFVIF